jgi:protein arginine N-methyltransferase 3
MSASLQAATAVPVDDSISDSDSASDSLSPEHDEGWEDVEPEDDSQAVVGLFSSDIYPNARLMLEEAKERYNFDLIKVQKDLGV